MKTIFFLRHGKADSYTDSDHNRKLTGEGLKQASKVGDTFKQYKVKFDLIISSTAIRAKQTAEQLRKNLDYEVDILYEHFLYEEYSSNQLIEYLKDLPHFFNSVLIVGHNPNLSYVSSNLSKSLDITMKPADYLGLNFKIDSWSDLEVRLGELVSF